MNISHENIERELRREDIEGFLETGAPEDEYASEAREIALSLTKIPINIRYEDSIIEIMSNIWASNFDLSEQDITLRLPAIQRVARRLIQSD